ncbi:hypothetical protein BKK50_11315 [Rodentibacter rarus]|uniref:Type VI secretion protein n=1 Tax=Rodentibacter rarus TaxID=1908260 RepID=A0A1V3IDR3_9PAST|nr:T6SS effector amidase Tae4 family protein [Rodentibacter rarus]OOF38728.1 hypothetical protein BKK50_11315 [Rodentibacter rarus]
MPNNITAKAKDKQKTLKVNRPSWEKVYEGYPKIEKDGMIYDLDAQSVFISILGKNYDQVTFGNACATRLSLGLINANVKIKKEYIVTEGKFKGKFITASAINMVKWLHRNFGDPDETIKFPQTYEEIVNAIGDRKGIYAMIPEKPDAFRASGHVTLWVNGDVIGGRSHSYYSSAYEVYFWELK